MNTKSYRHLFLLCFLFHIATANAWDCESRPLYTYETNFQAGYRWDELNWNTGIAVFGPNILSELKWNDLSTFQVGTELKFEHCNSFYVRGSGYYGRTFDGTVIDSDYQGDDRTFQYSRSISDAKGGYVADLTLGLGRIFYHSDYCFSLAPLVGYSFHLQHLCMRNGRQTFPFNAIIENLRSTYTARWNTAWVGVDMSFDAFDPCRFTLSYELHYAFFSGSGNWNLRTDFFDDFQQNTQGVGQVLTGGAYYFLSDCFNINLTAKLQGWYAWSGRSRIFSAQPEGNEVIDIELNRVCWNSVSIMLGCGWTY